MYDYFIGGKDNLAVDREKADALLDRVPEIARALRNNRAFLRRIVDHLAHAGIDQFIELGSGLPTSPNVHEVAREIQPDAHVVYVDNDPVVLAHDRALLSTTPPQVVTIPGDIREPAGILTHPDLTRLIDFSRPVAVLFIAILHFIPEDPTPLITAFTDRTVPGSYLAISHGVSDGHDTVAVEHIKSVYSTVSSPAVFRTSAEVEALFTGYDLVDPGLVDVTDWYPHGAPDHTVPGAGWYAGALGRKHNPPADG